MLNAKQYETWCSGPSVLQLQKKINLDRCVIGPQVRVGHDLVIARSGGWPWGLRRDLRGWGVKPGATLARLLLPVGDTGAQERTRSGP